MMIFFRTVFAVFKCCIVMLNRFYNRQGIKYITIHSRGFWTVFFPISNSINIYTIALCVCVWYVCVCVCQVDVCVMSAIVSVCMA